MKKIIPLFVFLMSVSGFIAIQSAWDMFKLNAQQQNEQSSEEKLYESLFSQSEFEDLEGKKYKLTELKTPVVILNFWASWCTPCLKEFPSLEELRKTLGPEKVAVFAINGDEENAKKNILKTAEKYKLNFHHVLDSDSKISDKFLVNSYPFTVVYVKGKFHKIMKKNFDFMEKDFRELLQKL
jgi:thiol-disulfide isomerase/thioredoxin